MERDSFLTQDTLCFGKNLWTQLTEAMKRRKRVGIATRDDASITHHHATQRRAHAPDCMGEIARRRDHTPFQVALAWMLAQDGIVAIPKASRIAHVDANARALQLGLTAAELAAIDRQFPPPTRKQALAML